MEIEKRVNGNNLYVVPIGRIDSNTSSELADFLEENFTDEIENLVLDFTYVDFISSKGLRIIVSIYKKLNGRKMKIIKTNSSVKEVFTLSGLNSVLDVQ